jgi:hypothetical protein
MEPIKQNELAQAIKKLRTKSDGRIDRMRSIIKKIQEPQQILKGSQGDSFHWKGEATATTPYRKNDVVHFEGSTYVATDTVVGFSLESPVWHLMTAKGADGAKGRAGKDGRDGLNGAEGKRGAAGRKGAQGIQGVMGLIWRGQYRLGVSYVVGDVVGLHGSAYVCIGDTEQSPPAGFGWEVLAVQGEQGVRGSMGITGATGATGAKGANGLQGETGLTGATGTAGLGQYAYSASDLQYDGTLTVVPKYGSPNINTNNASGVSTPNQVVFNLIHISTTVTINKILSYCGTGGGGTGNVLYGIYSVSSTGLPNTKLYGSGSIAFTAAAATQVSVTGVATVLVAGWYFLAAIYSDAAGAHVYSLSTEVFPAFGQMSSVMTSRSRCIFYDDSALAYGFTLQSSYPTANMYIEKRTTTVSMPALYFEIA